VELLSIKTRFMLLKTEKLLSKMGILLMHIGYLEIEVGLTVRLRFYLELGLFTS